MMVYSFTHEEYAGEPIYFEFKPNHKTPESALAEAREWHGQDEDWGDGFGVGPGINYDIVLLDLDGMDWPEGDGCTVPAERIQKLVVLP